MLNHSHSESKSNFVNLLKKKSTNKTKQNTGIHTLWSLAAHRLHITNAEESKELAGLFNVSFSSYTADNQETQHCIVRQLKSSSLLTTQSSFLPIRNFPIKIIYWYFYVWLNLGNSAI